LKNLFITGPPRSGKTTLIKKLCGIDSFKQACGGFYTEETREEEERSGFKIVTVPEGKTGLLAKKGLPSSHKVGLYGVNIAALEEIGCRAMIHSLREGKIILVDEIGKMELHSIKFKHTLVEGLDSSCKVLATIMERPNAFADKIKRRPDVQLLHLRRETSGEVFKAVKEWAKLES
jgi:nucleoside-triphosphatase